MAEVRDNSVASVDWVVGGLLRVEQYQDYADPVRSECRPRCCNAVYLHRHLCCVLEG